MKVREYDFSTIAPEDWIGINWIVGRDVKKVVFLKYSEGDKEEIANANIICALHFEDKPLKTDNASPFVKKIEEICKELMEIGIDNRHFRYFVTRDGHTREIERELFFKEGDAVSYGYLQNGKFVSNRKYWQ